MDWVIPLFADGSLQGSILVPILIGVLVATLFTEWYGWSFSGIVVPGYLTPIIIIAPFSAAVIGIEAIIVLGLTRIFSDKAPSWGWWAPLFGRDRFLLIFYLSVVVRLVLELGVLPGVETTFQDMFPGIDFRNRFTGIGLVVVPLLANMMWKPGVLRGFGQAVITTTITWALLTWLLVPHTNFNLGQFYLLYETMAIDFAASPTAYIVLLVGALIAAQLNLFLGWDFNGIMVPTLLAISLFQPMTFVLTFIEALAIYGCTWLVVRAPGARNISFEGPRLVALMYAIGLTMKLALEHLDLHIGNVVGDPQLNAYGYLLSTLIAAKMWQKHQAIRILVPILQVAGAIALLGGSGVWAFNALADVSWHQQTRLVLGAQDSRALRQERGDLMHLVNRELTRFLRPGGGQRMERMQPFEQQLYAEIVRSCSQAAAAGLPDRATVERLAAAAAQLGCELFELEDETTGDRLLILRESPLQARYRGWGLCALRIGSPADLCIIDPHPLADRGSPAAAVALADLTNAHALLLPGAHHQTNSDGSADPLRWSRLPVRLALAALPRAAVIDIRGGHGEHDQTAPTATLWIDGQIPDQLSLRDLENWLDGLAISLAPAPSPINNAALRRHRRPGFASLRIDRNGLTSLIGHRILADGQGEERILPRFHGLQHLRQRCEELRAVPYLQGARQVSQQDLLFIEEQVLWPLLEAAEHIDQRGPTAHQAQMLMAAAAENARRIGYRIELIDRDRGDRFILLSEAPEAHRGRGTYLLRLGRGRPVHLLVPQPVAVPGSLDAALALIDHLQARAISIGPMGIEESGRRNLDRTLRFEQESMYQLVHQLLQRRAWVDEPLLSLELRGTASISHDAFLREGRRIGGENGLSPAATDLLRRFRSRGWTVNVLGDAPGDETYGLGANRQLSYSDAYRGGPFVAVWLSRALRARLRFERDDDPMIEALRYLGLVGEPVPLAGALLALAQAERRDVPEALARELLAFAQDRNLRRIELLARECAAGGVPLHLYQDRDTNAVVCCLGSGADLLVIDLGAWDESHVALDPDNPTGAIDRFLEQRARSLALELVR